MKEEEARGKYCPFKYSGKSVYDTSCRPSRCMAWQETDPGHGFCGMIPIDARIRAMFQSEREGKSETK